MVNSGGSNTAPTVKENLPHLDDSVSINYVQDAGQN